MRNLRQKLLAGVALGLLVVPANAATVTFEFTDSNHTLVDSVVRHYSDADTDDLTLTVTASTKYLGGSGNYVDIPEDNIGQYDDYGLGVVNNGDQYWRERGTSYYAVDGYNGSDRLNLIFSEDVVLLEAEFFYYGDNTSFNFFNDEAGNGSLTLLDSRQFDEDSYFYPGHYGVYKFADNPANADTSLLGELFGLGAGERVQIGMTECNDGGGRRKRGGHKPKPCVEEPIYSYSGFKLISVTFATIIDDDSNIPEVPLPASLPLFGTGLALMGYLGMRRRKKANG